MRLFLVQTFWIYPLAMALPIQIQIVMATVIREPFAEQVFIYMKTRVVVFLGFILCAVFGALSTAHATVVVTSVAVNANSSLWVESDGSLWGMGDDNYGQYGDGIFDGSMRPRLILTNGAVKAAGGDTFNIVLKSDGSLWGTGDNNEGQLGLGDDFFDSTNVLTMIVASNVTSFACGDIATYFIKSDGSLWGMGDTSVSALGRTPQEIVSNNVVKVAGGSGHVLFIKSDGTLWAMGDGYYGELGDGIFWQTNDDFVYGSSVPEKIASNVVSIAAGSIFSAFVKTDGSLWMMGDNTYGQLGDGTMNPVCVPEMVVASNVVSVTANFFCTFFTKADGTLWGMGYNHNGELGLNFGTTNAPYSLVTPQLIASNVVSAVSGPSAGHTFFFKSDGTLWGFGDDGIEQLGDGLLSAFDPGPELLFPYPRPVLAEQAVLGTNLQFTAQCGFGGNFYLVASTNLATPLSQWTPVGTNVITYRTNAVFRSTLTNAVNSGAQTFYILQGQ